MERDDVETLVYRPYQPGDEALIRELFSLTFSRPWTPELWRWAYEGNPIPEKHIIVALQGRRLIGQSAGVPMTLRSGSQPLKASRIQNVMVHPDVRRLGIFAETMRRLEEDTRARGVDLLLSFPTDLRHTFAAFTKKLDYRHALDLHTWTLPLSRLPERLAPETAVEVRGDGAFTPEDAEFIAAALARFGLFQERSLAYLGWRYGAASGKTYAAARVRRGTELRALAVCKLYEAGSGLDLLELFARDDEAAAAALCGLRRRYSEEARTLNIWTLAHYPWHPLLLSLGLERTDFVTHVVRKDLSPRGAAGDCGATAYLSMGDSDVY